MQRTDWIDISKGIGIILVVYAHLLSSDYHAGVAINPHFFHLSDSLVYSFHMPLFFFLAGLLVENSYRKRGLRRFLGDKVRSFVWPYLIWSALQAILEVLFSSHSFRGATWRQVAAIPVLPWAQFWFLYALFGMYVLYGLLRHLPFFLGLFSLVAVVLYAFPLRTHLFALHGLSVELIFFDFGIVAKKYVVPLKKICPPATVTFLLILVFTGLGLVLFELVIPPTRLTDGSHPLVFFPLALLGIICCLGLARWIAGRAGADLFSSLGRHTLHIYLAHMLFGVMSRIILFHMAGVQNPFFQMAVALGAGVFGPIFLYRLSRQLGMTYLFGYR